MGSRSSERVDRRMRPARSGRRRAGRSTPPRRSPERRETIGAPPLAPTPGPPPKAMAHRADVQGLRAIAVLLVMVTHAGVSAVPGGFVGVDVFFVVSGFLITGLLLTEARAHGSVSLLAFYLRRARRILPAAALTLLVTDIAAFFILNFVRAREAVDDSVHAVAFAANFRFAARGVDYFAQGQPPSPILHYWSLSIEEQFYLLWPLLLSLALFGFALRRRPEAARHDRRLSLVVGVLAVTSLAWSVHRTATLPTEAYFSPFARAWELALGATLAVFAARLERIPAIVRALIGWAGIVGIGIAAVAFSDRTPFPGTAALLPTVGTALAREWDLVRRGWRSDACSPYDRCASSATGRTPSISGTGRS
jgi:peptidoglycan/LPS O-acetylase OafA/YrhL